MATTRMPAFEARRILAAEKTLYGLQRSPHHWYLAFTSVLKKMGLWLSKHDPCVYMGNPLGTGMLYIGIYIDHFIYFGDNDGTEACFKKALHKYL